MSFTVFDDWKNEPLDEIFYHCRELIEDETYPTIKKWRENGGKVLGHFQVYFPEELAHAAGMLPVKMCGFPLDPNHADSHFGSYLCSIIKTCLEACLSGSLELDMFVSHPICDAARNLAAIFGRNYDYPCQILYLTQNPNSEGSIEWLTDEYKRVAKVIEGVTGKTVTEDDLENSIAIFNENRALMRGLYDIKRDTPWLVTADEAYALVAVGGFIPREEHNDILRTVLPMIRERGGRKEDRIRIVYEGAFCEQPPLDLIRMLGRTCYVVDDDFLIGMRYILEDVATDNPMTNLAHAYIEQSSYSPVQHDLRKLKEDMLIERYKNANADAIIVSAAKMCEPGLEEQVAYSHALDAEGIPYFVSEFEENMNSFDQLELQIETFLENILFA
jgi:benzoyl-CoA reductase subunit C